MTEGAIFRLQYCSLNESVLRVLLMKLAGQTQSPELASSAIIMMTLEGHVIL
jgi:hypothetical protein